MEDELTQQMIQQLSQSARASVSPRNKIENRLNNTWKQNGLIVLLLIKKFVQKMKFHSKLYLFRRMNKKQFRIIGDQSVFFDFYQKNAFAKSRLVKFIRIVKSMVIFKQYNLVINPESILQLLWDGMVLIVMLSNIFYIPVQIAFQIDENQSNTISQTSSSSRGPNQISEHLLVFMNEIPNIVFLIDILLSFVTGYYQKGHLITRKMRIVKNYLRKEFFWDLIAIIPFFLKRWSENRYWGILLMLRVNKLFKILQNLEENLSLQDELASIYQFLKLTVTAIFMAHICGCIFFFVYTIENQHGVENTWISRINLEQVDWEQQYVASLYWGVITMITVGYGDIVPVTSQQRLVCIGMTLISCGVFGYAVNKIGNILQEMGQRDKSFKKKFNKINQYLLGRSLNRPLLMKVKRYCEYLHKEKASSIRKADEFFQTKFHSSLRNQVLTDINMQVIVEHKLFALNFSKRFLIGLAPLMKEKIYGPQEKLISFRSKNDKLFFVISGSISIYLGNQTNRVDLISDKNLLGVNSFFSQAESQMEAIAKNVVRVLIIELDTFQTLIEGFREDEEQYLQIKDQLNFYGKSFGLDFRCQSCHRYDHGVAQCPLVHVGIGREKIIIRNLKQEVQKERVKFQRCEYRKIFTQHSRQKMQIYASKAIRLIIEEGVKQNIRESILLEAIQNIENHNVVDRASLQNDRDWDYADTPILTRNRQKHLLPQLQQSQERQSDLLIEQENQTNPINIDVTHVAKKISNQNFRTQNNSDSEKKTTLYQSSQSKIESQLNIENSLSEENKEKSQNEVKLGGNETEKNVVESDDQNLKEPKELSSLNYIYEKNHHDMNFLDPEASNQSRLIKHNNQKENHVHYNQANHDNKKQFEKFPFIQQHKSEDKQQDFEKDFKSQSTLNRYVSILLDQNQIKKEPVSLDIDKYYQYSHYYPEWNINKVLQKFERLSERNSIIQLRRLQKIQVKESDVIHSPSSDNYKSLLSKYSASKDVLEIIKQNRRDGSLRSVDKRENSSYLKSFELSQIRKRRQQEEITQSQLKSATQYQPPKSQFSKLGLAQTS